MDVGVLAGLMVLLVMGTIASNGWDVVELRNREVWWWTAILALEALLMPNPYAGALMATVVAGLFQVGRLWYVLRLAIIPIAAIGASYALLAPRMQTWMVPYLLWTGVAVGMVLGAWAALGMYVVRQRPFRFIMPTSWFGWFGMWGVYEDLQHDPYLCGQANRVHLMTLSALAQACAVGLMWLGQWWAAPAWLICYLPQHANTKLEHWHHPNIGHLGQLSAGLALLSLLWPQASLATLAVGAVVASTLTWKARGAWQTHTIKGLKDQFQWSNKPWWQSLTGSPGEPWFDSGRLAYWKDVWQNVWWPSGWRKRLFGFGTCTWFVKTYHLSEHHPHLFTAAHNEYFQQLIEHGMVGLIVMLAYLGEAMWRLFHGGPEQQAVYLLGAVWCAIAFVHFPATLYHEYHPPGAKEEHWFGSPPLNVWSFMIALLAEAR